MRRAAIFGGMVGMALACGGGDDVETAVAPLPAETAPPDKVGEVIGTVAWFETNGPSCQWQVREFQTRTAPVVEPVPSRTLAVLDAPCPEGSGVLFFVNPAVDRAITWWSGDSGVIAWTVDLGTGAATRLPSLKNGVSYGFSSDGSVLGYTVDSTESMVEGWAKVFHFEGKEYPSEIQDGLPALAVAWRLDGASWTSTEAKVTSTGWDYAADEQMLETYKLAAGVRSSEIVGQFSGDGAMQAADEPTSKKLTSLGPIEANWVEGGEWQIVNQDGKYLGWYAVSGEFLMSSAPAYWDRGEGWQPLPDLAWKTGDSVDYAWRGRLVMASQYGNGPMFWDTKSGAHIAGAPKASTATFWPPVGPKVSRGE